VQAILDTETIGVHRLTFSPHGKMLVAGDRDSDIRIWDRDAKPEKQ
jgi:hypothetical protein